MRIGLVGKRIRHYRRSLNMTQEQLAEKADLSTNYIGMIENGQKKPSLESFIKITNAFNLTADDLLVDVVHKPCSKRACELSNMLEHLPNKKQQEIYSVIETMIGYS